MFRLLFPGKFRGQYRLLSVGVLSAPDRTDHVRQLGGGVGWHTGEFMRLGLDTEFVSRRSPLTGRSYEGWRTGLSITYGVKTP